VMRNTKLILLGGITNREHLDTGMREGFGFMAMGRALLREPGLVNAMHSDPAVRSRCTHNNKCMVTVFGRTHCVLDPSSATGRSLRWGSETSCATSRLMSARARCARSSMGIVRNPCTPP